MSKTNLIKAYDKLIDLANKAEANGDNVKRYSYLEEAKFIKELIEENF